MNKFRALFGIDKDSVKKSCILLPVLSKGILKDSVNFNFSRGKLYSCAQEKDFTVIHTRISPAFTGDAVLHLADTKVSNILFFGSCGLVKEAGELNIGSIVSPRVAYNMESFSCMLLENDYAPEASRPDKGLLEKLTHIGGRDIKKVDCATVGSLKLEEERIGDLIEKRIEIVDMECSAFFNACRYIKRRSAALLYVTDIVKLKPFYKKLDNKTKSAILNSIRGGFNILCKLTETPL